jgi:hypothetical protein
VPDLEINGQRLYAAEIRARAAQLIAERRAAGQDGFLAHADVESEALELLVDRTLLVQEAHRLGLEPRLPEIDETLAQVAGRYDGVAGCRAGFNTPLTREDLRRRIMVDRILNKWRNSVRHPRAEEVNKHYAEYKEQFYAPERINAAHVVRSIDRYNSSEEGREDVATLRARVENGEPFSSVATRYSDCPENNGELGWFPRGVMVEQFDAVVFAAPIGQLTPVFETPFGYHFALVHSHLPAGVLPLSEVRDQIHQSLWLTKQDREVSRRLSDLRSRAIIRSLA